MGTTLLPLFSVMDVTIALWAHIDYYYQKSTSCLGNTRLKICGIRYDLSSVKIAYLDRNLDRNYFLR